MSANATCGIIASDDVSARSRFVRSLLSGLPSIASQLSFGNWNNQSGSTLSALADNLASSKLWQSAIDAGSAVSMFPANASFCRRCKRPISSGSCVSLLSVKINQRVSSGRAPAGMRCNLFDLKLIISNLGH